MYDDFPIPTAPLALGGGGAYTASALPISLDMLLIITVVILLAGVALVRLHGRQRP